MVLVWCRKCVGLTSHTNLGKRLKSPQFVEWCNMENMFIDLQTGKGDEYDERSESQRLHEEDKRAHPLKLRGFGGRGIAQSKIGMFEECHTSSG